MPQIWRQRNLHAAATQGAEPRQAQASVPEGVPQTLARPCLVDAPGQAHALQQLCAAPWRTQSAAAAGACRAHLAGSGGPALPQPPRSCVQPGALALTRCSQAARACGGHLWRQSCCPRRRCCPRGRWGRPRPCPPRTAASSCRAPAAVSPGLHGDRPRSRRRAHPPLAATSCTQLGWSPRQVMRGASARRCTQRTPVQRCTLGRPSPWPACGCR